MAIVTATCDQLVVVSKEGSLLDIGRTVAMPSVPGQGNELWENPRTYTLTQTREYFFAEFRDQVRLSYPTLEVHFIYTLLVNIPLQQTAAAWTIPQAWFRCWCGPVLAAYTLICALFAAVVFLLLSEIRPSTSGCTRKHCIFQAACGMFTCTQS